MLSSSCSFPALCGSSSALSSPRRCLAAPASPCCPAVLLSSRCCVDALLGALPLLPACRRVAGVGPRARRPSCGDVARDSTSSSGRGQRRPFVSTLSARRIVADFRATRTRRTRHVRVLPLRPRRRQPGQPRLVVRRPPRRGTTSAAATRTDLHEMEPAEQEWRPSSSRASPTTPAACPRPHRPIRLAITLQLETTSPRTHAAQANKARARRERRSVSSSRTLAKRSQSV